MLSHVGQRFEDAYRTTPEPLIVSMLLLAGFAFEPDKTAAAATIRCALNMWCENGLGFVEAADGGRLFDPVEVICRLKLAARDRRDTFLAQYFAPTGRRLVQQLAARAPAQIRLDFSRHYHLRSHAEGDRVRLRVPLPLHDYHGPSVKVAARRSGAQGDLTVSDGRLELRGFAHGPGVVELGHRVTFKPSSGSGAAGTPADYLKPSEGLIHISDRVRALADLLAGPGGRPEAAVRAFWNFMLDELMCGPIHYDQVSSTTPCDWVLDSGWYDCQIGSALLIALCRARGIPARLVGGHVLYPAAPTNHYWAEVWFDHDGWLPMDLLCWDLSCGGADPDWRETFYGRIDPRMVTQCFPRQFTGALGVALPPVWHIIQSGATSRVEAASGVEIRLNDIAGDPVFVDSVAVLEGGDPPPAVARLRW